MILQNPWALWGLAAAATPVVIFLLLRRRKTEVPWGASYLLRLTLRTRRKSSLWKQLVVLAARVIVLAAAALLLSRPVQPNPRPLDRVPVLPDDPVHRVLLLDNSMSMSVEDAGGTRLARLLDALGVLLRSQRPGDALSLVPCVQEDAPEALRPVTLYDRVGSRQARRLLASVTPAESDLRLSAALAAAQARLALTPGMRAQLFILSDFPREIAADLEALAWFRNLRAAQKIEVIPVNMAPRDASAQRNIVLDAIDAGADVAVAGEPLTLRVKVANYADEEAGAVLHVQVNGAPAHDENVVLKPNERKTVPIPAVFTAAGDTLVKVTTAQGRLEAHGTQNLSLFVKDAVNVWLATDGAEAGSSEARPGADFLTRALQGGSGSSAFRVTPVRMFELTQTIPPEVDLIWIDAAQHALVGAIGPLSDFMRRGGGVVLAMGEGMGLDGYNTTFAKWLPSPLAGPAQPVTEPDNFVLPGGEPAPGASPLFEDITRPEGSDWSDVRFYNYVRLKQPDAARDVVFRFVNADPLLLHAGVGRGHFYLLTTSMGIEWNSLPVRQCFLPFVRKLSQAAIAGRVLPRNVEPGTQVALPWAAAGPATVVTPDLAQQPVDMVEGAGRFVRIDRPQRRGLYRLEGGGSTNVGFTVRGSVPEGDLRSLTPAQEAQLADALGAPLYPDWAAAVRALGSQDAARALWPWALVLMAAVYVFETWFVRFL